MDNELGKGWVPLGKIENMPGPVNLFDDVPSSELNEVYTLWQEAFEWSYYDGVLAGIASEKTKTHPIPDNRTFQALFCIDERECSIRRHIEYTDPACETLGTPGFSAWNFTCNRKTVILR